MEAMAGTMDMWHLTRLSQTTAFLTNSLVEDYQGCLLSKMKGENDGQVKKAMEMTLEEAVTGL